MIKFIKKLLRIKTKKIQFNTTDENFHTLIDGKYTKIEHLKIYEVDFEKNTITLKVNDEFFNKYRIRQGQVNLLIGKGLIGGAILSAK